MLISAGLPVSANAINKGCRRAHEGVPECQAPCGQPSPHRRKNCVSRNQAQTLAHERVTRQPPTLDYGSTGIPIGDAEKLCETASSRWLPSCPNKQTNSRPLRRLGPVANIDTKLLIYGLFQKGRVLAQDGIGPLTGPCSVEKEAARRVNGRARGYRGSWPSTFWSRYGPGLLDVQSWPRDLDPGLRPGSVASRFWTVFPRAYGEPESPAATSPSQGIGVTSFE